MSITELAEPMEEQVGVEQKEREELVSDPAVPDEEKTTRARCIYCGDGMVREDVPRFNRGFGVLILVIGVLLALFMPLLLGLPVVVIGTYLAVASRSVWICRGCGAVVDRHAG